MRITFLSRAVATAYGSMAEGMSEVQSACDEPDYAEQLDSLAGAVWAMVAAGALQLELPDTYWEVADSTLENCLDSSYGWSREDDPDADYYVFAGEVTIER